MPLIPLIATQFLDPRPSADAALAPLAHAANFPLDELPERTHELPPREKMIRVVGPMDLAQAAIAWLQAAGRLAEYAGAGDLIAAPAAAAARLRLWEPNEFLASVIPELAPARALDLACGVGREAVFLASCGWNVTGVDLLPDAIERAKALESRCAGACLPVDWQVGDLESESAPWTATRRIELITAFRYLHRPLFGRLRHWLAPGGSVVYETFTTLHRARHGKPARNRFVLEPNELPTLLSGLTIRHYSEAWRGDAHTARIWAMYSDSSKAR